MASKKPTSSKKPTEPKKLSKKESDGLKKGINKIIADSKKQAKRQTAINNAPKDNWITRIGN